MERLKTLGVSALVICLLLFASYSGILCSSDAPVMTVARDVTVFFLYICMIMAWGVSLWKRIMHRPIQKYLLFIVGCMLFWIFVRTCKNQFFQNLEPWGRWFWYQYYIPMILIPLFGLFVAAYIGKPEDWRLPKGYFVLLVPALFLITGVLTNDLHELAFAFPNGYDADYTRSFIYYAVVVWMLGMLLATIGVLWYKCRLPYIKRRVWLPLSFVGVGVLYCVLYWIDSSKTRFGFVEMTVMYCALTAAIWESFISTGLIPSNKKYKTFFQESSVGAQIVDTDGSKRYWSKTAAKISEETFERLKTETVFESNGDTELHMKALRCGYVIWQEDLSAVNRGLEALQETERELKDRTQLLHAELKQKSQALKVQEQTKIYRVITAQTAGQLEKIEQLLKQLECSDAAQSRCILSEINVIGAYIKRRSNLILLKEAHKEIPGEELLRCLEESIENLKVCGVHCTAAVTGIKTLDPDYGAMFYDLFEAVIESTLPSLHTLLAVVSRRGAMLRLSVSVECDKEIDKLIDDQWQQATQSRLGGCFTCELQENSAHISLCLPEGGGKQ